MDRLFTWEDTREWLMAGPRIHSLQGVVKSVVQSLDMGGADGDGFQMKVIWRDSGEAEEHLAVAGRSETPVCWMLVGYASGYASYCLGRDVFFIERKCVGRGDRVCTAEGRTRAGWGDELTPHLPFFKAEDIHGKIVSLTRKLRSKSNALERERRRRKLLERRQAFVHTEVRSPAYRRVLELADRVARYDTTVLITGETGTGKEVLARYIHQHSLRAKKPFVAINCAALPDTLLESELFGYTSGAFTGASHDRVGLFEEAGGGTVLLDEIGDISANMQVKLLRALQEKEILRLGENRPRKIDIRVIATTNRDLSKAVAEGRFREDLYYRLSVFQVTIPPLRERTEDILPLARHFVESTAQKLGLRNLRLDAAALDYLLMYPWPGNVRELENTIERAAVLSTEGVIRPEHLPDAILRCKRQGPATREPKIGGDCSLRDLEQAHILATLERMAGNRSATAKALGISPVTLWRRLKAMERSAGSGYYTTNAPPKPSDH